MRMGCHREQLAGSLDIADAIYLFQPGDLGWSLQEVAGQCQSPATVLSDVDELVATLAADARKGDHVVIMSNGGFGGIHAKLLKALEY